MKVLLMDQETRLYYAGESRWVRDLAGAVSFSAPETAGQKSLQWPGRPLAVVLSYENPDCQLALSPVFCIPKLKAS